MTETLSPYVVDDVIRTIRGHKVILDSDLAHIYGVETKNLNKAVARNKTRFPEDFAFQLTTEEFANLKFQNGTSSLYHANNEHVVQDQAKTTAASGHGGRRKLPLVFTELISILGWRTASAAGFKVE